MDNTNDPVSVLRAAIETVCEGWTLPADARKVLEAALWDPAAIQHSEQRETVPAGEAVIADANRYQQIKRHAFNKTCNGFTGEVLQWTLVFPASEEDQTSIDAAVDEYAAFYGDAPVYAAPVAAPIPEAKAFTLHANAGPVPGDGPVDRFVNSLPLPQFTAPAVKHEASELGEELKAAPFSLSPHLAYAVASHVAARQSAPPIAVQGSIGEDAEFKRLLHRVMTEDGERKGGAYISLAAYIDSRSPVAAAPVAAAPAGYGDVLEGGA